MKIIAAYLPQYHETPENNEWWGKGFTEWTNLRNARPLFEGHYQPRVPLGGNYYDLSDPETLRWQCRIAREHGIYGFSFYHYWVNGRLLLNKPMELLLAHPEIDINYCICWANHDWTDSWKAGDGNVHVLLAHDFDDEKDWVDHFNYMLPFLRDPRYMREGNKPYMVIYVPHLIGKLTKMQDLWTRMAVEAGFDGLTYFYQSAASATSPGWDRSRFDYGIEFHPGYAEMVSDRRPFSGLTNVLMRYSRLIKKKLGITRSLVAADKGLTVRRYEDLWEKITSLRPKDGTMVPAGFVDWDNTPRYLGRGKVYQGACPEVFRKYFRQLVLNAREYYHKDMMFFFAWNEWSEGGYLEPDEKFGYAYLDAIKEVLDELHEDWKE